MKTVISLFSVVCVLSFLLTVPPSVYAQDATATIDPILESGLNRSHWKALDESGAEVWLIRRADEGVELRGRDAASTFEGLLIEGEDSGSYLCIGRGFRFVGGVAFTYRSTFTEVEKDGAKALSEKWKATLVTGEKIEGESLFFRVSEQDK